MSVTLFVKAMASFIGWQAVFGDGLGVGVAASAAAASSERERAGMAALAELN